MEEDGPSPLILDAQIKRINFFLSNDEEICTYSVNECPISHPSQLGNPFLGLPLELGKCESCGTSEPGKCEGHFGYVELPVAVFHPSHVSELAALLNLICLKCLRLKKGKVKSNRGEIASATCICRDLPEITIKEVKKSDGAISLELRTKKRSLSTSFWNFLNRFGFPYGDGSVRPLLPIEALNILRQVPEETKKKFAAKGYFPQSGYILLHLPVPPNCLHVPEFSDGNTIISFDVSHTLLKKVLSKIEQIKRSRSGTPNFESHEAESLDLQFSIAQYLNLRGTTTGPQDTKRYTVGNNTEKAANQVSNKQWLEKMKTLFISKGSGFSSRSVITGDPYIGINVIGLPSEIARKITFEERVTSHNLTRLQEMVDKGLCVTYIDGSTSYSLSDSSKGYTCLKIGQVVHRRIMDGDLVFVNRPPSTHKHSLQAFYVYVHDDHTVKINPLICSPFGADFDGDCIHIFYPQSLAAKAEAIELFSVEQQLVNSYNGSLFLQVAHDSLLGLKFLMKYSFLKKPIAQQLAMCSSHLDLQPPAILKSPKGGENQALYTVCQLIQSALPRNFESEGERHEAVRGELTRVDLDRDFIQGSFAEIVGSIFSNGSKEALNFMDIIQPMMMELLNLEGFSVSLVDFDVPKPTLRSIRKDIQRQAYSLSAKNPNPNQPMDLRVEGYLRQFKQSIADVIVRSSSVSYLMDTKSDSSITKVVQQLGFLGLQLYRQGRFYSKQLVEDCLDTYKTRYSVSDEEQSGDHPSEAYGLVKTSFFDGLNPFESLVHAISAREVIVRSSRGLTEPGTLFKNLMAVLRDVVICYDGTVRNMCSNSVIQFSYGDEKDEVRANKIAPPGEPVGVLAATAISNPAYKAVLDSSQSNNTSWELMKEVLLTRAKSASKNIDARERRVIVFLQDCFCGKRFCKERAALAVQSCLKRVRLEDCATDFSIEHQMSDANPCLVGHIHLDKGHLERINTSMDDILVRCQDVLARTRRKGTVAHLLKRLLLSACECCNLESAKGGSPCLQFSFSDDNQTSNSENFDQHVRVLANNISPILLDTIIRGDPRVSEAKIVWMGPEEISWVRNYSREIKGEVAIEVEIEEDAVRQSGGDAWGTCIDACIPVIDLIDTRRSIPYSIQRVKELLGISCAFEQVVQRLYMAVRGVAKGVLKEHLIVVANSMTCTGNLNGFNTAGYKAMFRSLKIQVPFTEATLYTPMKCFDRAAEKCHSDTLASAVSSCAWGRNVALGTGSDFQILWDKNQLAGNKECDKGIYDFLSLVRNPTQKGGNVDDVDYLEENGNFEDCPSPELGAFGDKPTFEDDMEEDNNTWGVNKANNDNNNNSSWEIDAGTGAGNDGGDSWGGWGESNKSDNKGKEKVEVIGSDNAWGSKPASAANGGDDPWGSAGASEEKPIAVGDDSWGNFGAPKGNVGTVGDGAWGNAGASKENAATAMNDSWASLGASKDKDNATAGGEDSWGNMGIQKKKETPFVLEGNPIDASEWENNDPWDQSDDTNQDAPPTPKEPTWANDSFSRKKPFESRKKDRENTDWGSKDKNANGGSWGGGGSSGAEWGNNNNKEEEEEAPPTPKHNTWDPPQNDENTPWGSKKADDNTAGSGDPWSCSTPVKSEEGGWGSKESDGWGASVNNTADDIGGGDSNNDGWSGPRSKKWNGNNSGRGGGRGGGRPPRRPDGEGGRGFVKRPPPNPFTADEEKILFDIEPLVQNVKRIFRESIDGDKLAEEDQKFLVEKIFEFHPTKDSKVTDKIDHFMVNKHAEYQSTRCFFVVSADGTANDFSYLKCVANFVKLNYPEHGESFCAKFFKKRRDPPTPDPTQPTPDGGPQPPPESGTQSTNDGGTQPFADDWSKPATDQPAVNNDWSNPAADSGTQTLTDGGTQTLTDGWSQPGTESGAQPVADGGTQTVADDGWSQPGGGADGGFETIKDDWA